MKKVAIVTGGSSGIGLATAKALVSKQYIVYSLNRKEFVDEDIKFISVDITNEDDVRKVINDIYEKEKQIDLLINSAGNAYGGAVEFTKKEEAYNQFSVAFFGLDNVVRSVLPIMRKQRNGKIINVSSMGALAPLPFQTYYSSMKAAVNTYTCALRNEVGMYDIQVCAVLPGDLKTNLTFQRHASSIGDEEYNGRISKAIKKMAEDERSGPTPDKAGEVIAKIALKKNVKPLYALDPLSKIEAILFKLLPIRFTNYVVGKLYGQQE